MGASGAGASLRFEPPPFPRDFSPWWLPSPPLWSRTSVSFASPFPPLRVPQSPGGTTPPPVVTSYCAFCGISPAPSAVGAVAAFVLCLALCARFTVRPPRDAGSNRSAGGTEILITHFPVSELCLPCRWTPTCLRCSGPRSSHARAMRTTFCHDHGLSSFGHQCAQVTASDFTNGLIWPPLRPR